MKPRFVSISAIICTLGLALFQARSVQADETLSLTGYVQFDKRFLVQQDGAPQYPMYHTGYLELQADPSDDVEARISTMIRYYDFSALKDVEGITDSDQAFPLDILLWEAYVDLYSFAGIEGLDLRIGKQRIAWGTADRLNPTDNLNPDDFTDFFNFGAKVPTWALKMEWSIIEDRLKLTGVFLPGIVPISLPRFGEMPLMTGDLPVGRLPEGMKIEGMRSSVASPKYDFEHLMQAVKVSGTLLTVDWSVSYFHGWDDLFYPYKVNVELQSLNSVTINTEMAYPELHVVGFDLAGELFTVGWWAEVAVFIPERECDTFVTIPTGISSYQTTKSAALKDDPYVKYTVGLDYTFSWGTYLNFQYSRGFFTERGKGQLHDYFMARLEQKFLNDDLTLALSAFYETKQFENITDDYGIGVSPEITWKPYDNVDLVLGYMAVLGGGNSLFAAFNDWDMAYLKIKASF
ncbi:MAG: hypothetical protein GXP49_07920 [Deltaproteobacteria bacterium]|nr:hypothetical protein [Deltaproteobacteria bacterium]